MRFCAPSCRGSIMTAFSRRPSRWRASWLNAAHWNDWSKMRPSPRASQRSLDARDLEYPFGAVELHIIAAERAVRDGDSVFRGVGFEACAISVALELPPYL